MSGKKTNQPVKIHNESGVVEVSNSRMRIKRIPRPNQKKSIGESNASK